MSVKLKRIAPGLYQAMVRPQGTGLPAIELQVVGPDPQYPTGDPSYRWQVVSDTERWFSTLKAARSYVNRFFEEAK